MQRVYLFPHEPIQQIVQQIFERSGSPQAEAALIAQRLIKSNLTGHDSHGIMRVPQYMGWIRDGTLKPGQHAEVLHDHGATAVLSGHRGYGQVIADEAMQQAITRARQYQVAAVGVTDLSHIGRLADYAIMAAEAQMVGLVFTCSGGFSKLVAPFGGSQARMSTNPMAAAFPSDRADPIVFDMATSTYAEGKIRLCKDTGLPTPPNVLIDQDAQATTDPEALYAGGAIKPLGGDQGYKGYLLNFMVEVLAGLLTGGGFVGQNRKDPPFNNCSLMIVLNVAAFRQLPAFKDELEQFITYLKATKPVDDGQVFYPGELEAQKQAQRSTAGIPLAEATIHQLQEEMTRLNVRGNLLDMGTESK